jgi:hypothetical protein
VRVIDLSFTFHRTRLHLAPIGSPADVALRNVIRRLGSELHPIPAAEDVEAFRTPVGPCWMRPVPGTPLGLQYTFTPPFVHVLALLEQPAR